MGGTYRTEKMAAGELAGGGSEDGGSGEGAELAPGATTIAHLPEAVVETVLLKLDVPSLCSVAATCRSLRNYATRTLSFLPALHLLVSPSCNLVLLVFSDHVWVVVNSVVVFDQEVSPTLDLLLPLLPLNPYLRSLKLDCGRLGDSAIGGLARSSLEELCLLNCDNFSGKLLSEVGRRCKALR